jgi:hypothetical protein
MVSILNELICLVNSSTLIHLKQVRKPLDLLLDMVLRFLLRGAAGDQVFFDLDAPVNQRHRFFVELLFLLGHGIALQCKTGAAAPVVEAS